MTWAVLGAVEAEVWPVIDNLSQARETRWNDQAIFQGKIESQEAVVMPTGVGKVRTAASVQHLLDRFPIEAIIFTGAAGAINPEVKIGDVIIGEKTVQHDYDTGGKGLLEEMKTTWFEADPGLVALAVRAGQDTELGDRLRIGTILTGDQTIVDSRKRAWLRQTFRGDCVEMEGAAVASVCARNNVPFVLIRAITDFADENARTDFRQNRSQAAMNSAAVVLAMFGKTGHIRSRRRNLAYRVRRTLSRKAWASVLRLSSVRLPRQGRQ
jgi:adenosylhomocysteine nucleosidase